MARLVDVAARAGVSPMTVSNVLNGRRAKASAEVIDRVNRAVKELGYVPNRSARSLARRSTTDLVALVSLAGEKSEGMMSTPSSADLIRHIEEHIRLRGSFLMMRTVDGFADVATEVGSWKPDGIIFTPMSARDATHLSSTLEMPTVFLDNYSTGERCTIVRQADEQAAYEAVTHLAELGHTRIAIAGEVGFDYDVIDRRHAGYLRAMTAINGRKPLKKNEIRCTNSFEGGITAGRRLARRADEFTAVLCTSDLIAIGIMESLRNAGVRVPHDVSIMGMDDSELAKYVTPKLATVAEDIDTKAARAVELLFAQIGGDTDARGTKVVVPTSIRDRESVRPLDA
ncbi:LacI family DNA-binding transcriptional regulator [Mariniluteicoccus flavus]